MQRMNAIKQNELEVNELLFKLLKIFLLIFPLIFLLKIVGIFMPSWLLTIILIVLGSVIFLIPIIYYKSSASKEHFKYLAIICLSIFICISYSFLFVTTIFLWIMPIGIACLYFDRKFVRFSFILTFILFMIGDFFACITPNTGSETGVGQAFIAEIQWLPIHAISFAIQFIILASIFISLTKRANNMLNNTENLLLKINSIFEESNTASEELKNNVEILLHNVNESNFAIEHISESIQNISNNSKDLQEDVSQTTHTVDTISKDIDETVHKSNLVTKNTQEISEISNENKLDLLKSVEDIREVDNYTKMTKNAIKKLVDNSKEISKVVSLISSISEETNLLSLNASIEAARAGEAGRGFGVVATQVKKLAEQSHQHAIQIGEVLDQISNDAMLADEMIEDTHSVVQTSITAVNKAVSSFENVLNKQDVIISQMDEISILISNLDSKSSNIKTNMINLENKNDNNCDKISDISASSEELYATSSEIANYIKKINEKAIDLANIKM